MKITKSKLRQIIKEELLKEVGSLPRDEEEAKCIGFILKLSDELSETLPSLEGVMVQDILIDLQLRYLSLEHHELKDLEAKVGNCYKLFVKALESKEVGVEGTDTWGQAKEKLAKFPRFKNARDVYEKYYNSQMSPKKMVNPAKSMGTATTIAHPKVKTKPLYQAPKPPPTNPFRVKKLGPHGRYRQ